MATQNSSQVSNIWSSTAGYMGDVDVDVDVDVNVNVNVNATTNVTSTPLTGFDAFCGDVFFNESLLLDNTWPQFSRCFIDTVLVWVPSALLGVMIACYCYFYRSSSSSSSTTSRKDPLPFSLLNASKLFCCCILALFSVVALLDRLEQSPQGAAGYVGDVILFLTMVTAAGMTQYERLKGIHTSPIAFVFWFIKLLCDVIPLYTVFMTEVYETDVLQFVLMLARYVLVLVMVVLYAFAEGFQPTKDGYTTLGKKTCPETQVSFLSQITFSWLTKLVILGYKRDLEATDMWDLNPRDLCDRQVFVFEQLWEQEVAHCMSKGVVQEEPSVSYKRGSVSTANGTRRSRSEVDERSLLREPRVQGTPSYTDFFDVTPLQVYRFKARPSLFRVLWRQYRGNMLHCLLLKLVSDVALMTGPLLLGQLITLTGKDGEGRKWQGYVLALGLMASGVIKSFFFSGSMYRSWLMGMHFKAVLVSAVYSKALRIGNESRKQYNQGDIVNLMSVDAQRIQDFMTRVFFSLTTPLQIIMALALIYVYVGASVFAGFLLLVFLIPFNAFMAGKQRKFQEQNLRFKDIRVKLVNEILNGIKVLKMYAWEPSFEKRVTKVRYMEIAYLFKIAILYLCTGLCWNIAPFLVTLTTFTVYVLTQPDSFLDPSKAFVTLALFNILRSPMDILSTMISYSVQAHVSAKRINKFLCAEEMDRNAVTRVTDSGPAAYAVKVDKASFSWGKAPPTLKHLNVEVKVGKLVAVVGQVGAGKSSFISCLLGEMDKQCGQVTLKGSVAYVAQQAWIQNGTVRDNILFRSEYKQTRYRSVLKACQLERDLRILAGGDMTEIGEKGINVSGGQKQRVSLARAVYSDSDVYLLDDPLSAVDSHVGKALFNDVIGPKGILQNKTRVLVTHGVHFLPLMDEIIVLSNGRVSAQGSYEQLMMTDGPFAQFLKAHLMDSNNSTEDEDDEDPEVLAMKQKILDHVESLTSDGGATSGDDIRGKYRRRRQKSREAGKKKEDKQIPQKSRDNASLGQLTTVEKMETGQVSWPVYWMYLKAAGPLPFGLAMLCFGGFQAASVWANFRLSQWTDDPLLNNQSLWGSEAIIRANRSYLTSYGLIGVVQFLLLLVYNYLYWTRMVYAGRAVHDRLLKRLFRAPMAFFDTTPMGRIMNRVSRDVEVVDSLLPLIFRDFLTTSVLMLATLITILIQTPLFGAVLVPLIIIFYFIQRLYIPMSRQVKRMDAVTRSPIFTHFSESISGAATIRAYGVTPRFIEENKLRVDLNQVFFFATATSYRWLQINMDWLSNIIVFSAAVFELVSSSSTGGGLGLAVSYALQVSGTITFMVRQASDFETNIVSVERLKEYASVETEAEWVKPQKRPLPNWPQQGEIVLNDYHTRYRPGLDLVLRHVSCAVKPGEKVGVVGRTGAGKSSLTLSLFRIVEAVGGAIIIDGINIADIGLHDLRSRLTILPQDPVLFSGSLRFNLDPLEQYTDPEVWQSLERAHLKTFVSSLSDGLYHECGEEGHNLSMGQRQLVCLARTLLRHTKVLVLDEATAAVDLETDSLIQNTIRMAFHSCTIITIAHRLNTILDYDRIMVMDEGRIKEFDSPSTLLENKESLFYSMARDAGLV